MPTPTTANLIWHDSEFCRERTRKSAAALVAVERTLRKRQPLNGKEQEFLDTYERATNSNPEVFADIWSAPYAYWWMRIAYQLLQANVRNAVQQPTTGRRGELQGDENPGQALLGHLEQFKRIALAIAIRTGEDWMFETPLRTTLPISFPTTEYSLSGAGTVDVLGISAGCLLVVTDSGRTVSVPSLHVQPFADDELQRNVAPIVQHRGCRLLLQPHAFHIPDLPDTQEVVRAGIDLQYRYQDVVRETLAVLENYDPLVFEQFQDTMTLVALKPFGAGGLTNTSYSMLPGAFTTTAIRNPLALAEDFIHELYHNRLFALEERGRFFDLSAGDARLEAKFYSPWREDPRPLYGVFHALYVFTRVCGFWLRVHDDTELTDADRTYAAGRIRGTVRRLQMAESVLRRRACFTAWGSELFEEMSVEVRRLTTEVSRADLPADMPCLEADECGGYQPLRSETDGRCLSVEQALAEHQRSFDFDGLCERFFASSSTTTV
jgi:HEXXH motif-containing protein